MFEKKNEGKGEWVVDRSGSKLEMWVCYGDGAMDHSPHNIRTTRTPSHTTNPIPQLKRKTCRPHHFIHFSLIFGIYFNTLPKQKQKLFPVKPQVNMLTL